MTEENAIKFYVLHLIRIAHDWWHHGLITQGHQSINTYDKFTQKLIKRFDQRHPEWYFRELTKLRQQGTIESYATEFQKLVVMVPEISQERLTYLFIEGLTGSVKILVRTLEPTHLDEAIQKAMKNEDNWARDKNRNTTFLARPLRKEERPKREATPRTCQYCKKVRDQFHLCKTMEDLKEKGLCYTCQQPWGRDNKFQSRAHQIIAHPEEEWPNKKSRIEKKGQITLATITQASKHCPFRIKSTIRGRKIVTLVDSGVSHNFIDKRIVKQRKLPTIPFKGFEAATATGAKI